MLQADSEAMQAITLVQGRILLVSILSSSLQKLFIALKIYTHSDCSAFLLYTSGLQTETLILCTFYSDQSTWCD